MSAYNVDYGKVYISNIDDKITVAPYYDSKVSDTLKEIKKRLDELEGKRTEDIIYKRISVRL